MVSEGLLWRGTRTMNSVVGWSSFFSAQSLRRDSAIYVVQINFEAQTRYCWSVFFTVSLKIHIAPVWCFHQPVSLHNYSLNYIGEKRQQWRELSC